MSVLEDQLQKPGDRLAKIVLDCPDALIEPVLVRIVPGKRFVCQARWQCQQVFAKIFIGDKANAYASRDKRGVDWLLDAQIPTPAILAVQRLENSAGTVLIYQAVVDSVNAEDAYAQMDALAVRVLMTQLVKTVALHHQAGLIQTDLYLKNFLIKSQHLYTLDGDGIRRYTKLNQRKAKRNLAVLLSKFDVLQLEECCSGLLEAYTQLNPLVHLDEYEMKKLAHQYRMKAASDYADKKVFRACTDVVVRESQPNVLLIAGVYHHLPLPDNVQGFDALINAEHLLKNGSTCTVGLARLGEHDIVVKRYNLKNIIHALGRMFRRTRASQSWANAHRLQLLGIPTARPVALFEQRTFKYLRGKAFFLSAFVDQCDVDAFFEHTRNSQLRAVAVKNIVQLFYRLFLLRISHGDTKATNIKVLDNGVPLLIDLDSMQQHKYVSAANKAHARDIKRFMRNWKVQSSLYNAFVEIFQVVYADHAVLHDAEIIEQR